MLNVLVPFLNVLLNSLSCQHNVINHMMNDMIIFSTVGHHRWVANDFSSDRKPPGSAACLGKCLDGPTQSDLAFRTVNWNTVCSKDISFTVKTLETTLTKIHIIRHYLNQKKTCSQHLLIVKIFCYNSFNNVTVLNMLMTGSHYILLYMALSRILKAMWWCDAD